MKCTAGQVHEWAHIAGMLAGIIGTKRRLLDDDIALRQLNNPIDHGFKKAIEVRVAHRKLACRRYGPLRLEP